MADPIVWDGSLPLYVSHRGAQAVWNVEKHSETIYHNHVVTFGVIIDPPQEFVLVVDAAGWPIENQYGYDYKEYRVTNEVPTS